MPSENKVTYYNVRSSPYSDLTLEHFGQLDYILLPNQDPQKIRHLASDMLEAMPSHHFLLECRMQCDIEKQTPKTAAPCFDRSALTCISTRNRFAEIFMEEMQECQPGSLMLDLDARGKCVNDAFLRAATLALPARQATKRRPWIHDATLQLIDERNSARRSNDAAKEHVLNASIRSAVKTDRAAWLNRLAVR